MASPLLIDSSLPAKLISGMCRFCRCYGGSCRDRAGEPCDWIDENHTCCTAEKCLARLAHPFKLPSQPPPGQGHAKPTAAPIKQIKPKKSRRSSWDALAALNRHRDF